MPLNYSISLLPNPAKPDEAKKAYAKAQVNRELSLRELSARVASQTTVSRADVYAVIIATVDNMVDALRAGDQVDFGELGKFRLQVSSKGAETAEAFTREPYHRRQHPVCPRRGPEEPLPGDGVHARAHPCRCPCRAQGAKGGRDHRGHHAALHAG